MENIKKKS